MTSRRALAAVLTAAALAVASCGATPTASKDARSVQASSRTAAEIAPGADWPTATLAEPGGTPAGPLPHPSDIEATDPDQVASGAVIALYTVDTATDASPTDAYRRATPWLTADLAADLAATPPLSGTNWLNLAAHRGYTTVTDVSITSEYGQPADTAHNAYRTVTYTVKTVHRDGAHPPTAVRGARYVRLVHADGTWKVNGLIS